MTEHRLEEFYTPFYTIGNKHDSPIESRVNMARRIRHKIEAAKQPVSVLGVGSGRGDVEAMVLRDARNSGNTPWQRHARQSFFVTLDIADIPFRKLVNGGRRQRTHVRGDSRQLPFSDDSFDIVTSNLSVDMLRRNKNLDYEKALREMRRVLKMGGVALFSFHPANLFNNLSEYYKGEGGVTGEYFDGVAENNPFYDNSEDIIRDLAEAELATESIELVSSKRREDKWWEVTARYSRQE